jgi:hypothetical protein
LTFVVRSLEDEPMTTKTVQAACRAAAKRAGSRLAFAKQHGLSECTLRRIERTGALPGRSHQLALAYAKALGLPAPKAKA